MFGCCGRSSESVVAISLYSRFVIIGLIGCLCDPNARFFYFCIKCNKTTAIALESKRSLDHGMENRPFCLCSCYFPVIHHVLQITAHVEEDARK